MTDRLKALTIVGTRPEAIKLAPVIMAMRADPRFEPRLCATAQHRELMDDGLRVFGLVPDHDLDVMQADQPLADVTAKLVTRISEVIIDEKPDIVLVEGDTASAFTGALAAFYQRVPVAHVEAGLRSGDRYSPYPEETLRRLIAHLAIIHFAPTDRAARNLVREALYPDAEIYLTGNPVVDAVRWIAAHPPADSAPLDGSRMILVTAHRRENFGAPLERICRAIRRIADAREDVIVIYPVHPNPNVIGPVGAALSRHPRIRLIPPQDYAHFVALMSASYLILTDSGGVQEEAPVLGRPVLVMREETERSEAIEAGNAILVQTDTDNITKTALHLLDDAEAYRFHARVTSPFGDGHSAGRILDVLAARYLGVENGAERYLYTPTELS